MKRFFRPFAMLLGSLLLAACAGYDGYRLKPGATLDEVIASMGQPALRWQETDGRQQLAYPRGPLGVHTFMAHIGPDQRLVLLENVLESRHFARIQPGLTQEQVLRLIGPPNPYWSVHFEARNELAWEWQFCDDWSKLARFGVLFDAQTGIVRSAYQRPEMRGRDNAAPFCGR